MKKATQLSALVGLIALGGARNVSAQIPSQWDTRAFTYEVARLTDTASSAAPTAPTSVAGWNGRVVGCGLGAGSRRSITCSAKGVGTIAASTTLTLPTSGTATSVRTMAYPSGLTILVNDGNADDTLIWDDVDVSLTCTDLFGKSSIYTYSNLDLTEAGQALGASNEGFTPYCFSISSVTFSNNNTTDVHNVTEYWTGDSSDQVVIASNDNIVIPVANLRTPQTQLDSLCLRAAASQFCTRIENCTTGVIRGGRAGAFVDVSTCFAGTAVSPPDISTLTVNGLRVIVTGHRGTY